MLCGETQFAFDVDADWQVSGVSIRLTSGSLVATIPLAPAGPMQEHLDPEAIGFER